ncbi:MAG: hypothetical protein IT233_12755 [Bacteroidia bacterium]|nr:hypothetical protein [Bacteroidia bacterium]
MPDFPIPAIFEKPSRVKNGMFRQTFTNHFSTLPPQYTESYRYGFDGVEKDDEVKGSGNSYDFGARIYDPRLGRWLSVDPLSKNYPSYSPFNFASSNPVYFIDRDGRVQVDAQGNIIYEVNPSKKPSEYDQGDYKVTVTPVFIFANDGRKIEVQHYTVINKKTGRSVDNSVIQDSYNCHGMTSLSSEFRVGSKSDKSESNALLLDKGGFSPEKELSGGVNQEFSKIKKGDIIVLFNKDGVAIHSYVYDGDGTVTSKNGERKINELNVDNKDSKKGTFVKENATVEDIYNLYASEKDPATAMGFFTPVKDAIISTNRTVTTEFKTASDHTRERSSVDIAPAVSTCVGCKQGD